MEKEVDGQRRVVQGHGGWQAGTKKYTDGLQEDESIPTGLKDADKHDHVHTFHTRWAADKDDERKII